MQWYAGSPHIPTLISGDFNLVRYQKDKSNGVVNQKWCDKFNAWIELWGLLEVKLGNRKFTWANKQENLIMSTIYRVFCNTELDALFPLASTQAYSRLGSDHTPILWDSGLNHIPQKSSYKFEKWWLLREDFSDLVANSWNAPTKGKSATEVWQEKVRRFRKTSKGWSRNIEADLRQLKLEMMEEYEFLDIKTENGTLSELENKRMRFIHSEMQKIWLKEETKAKQRSRDRDIKEGDRNTAYFHAVANQRRRKTLVHSLEGPNGPTSDLGDMLDIATSFYKDLFQKENRDGFSLADDFFSQDEKVSAEDNAMLDSPFTEEEVKIAIFNSYSDGAPGPDGLSFMFYQKKLEFGKPRCDGPLPGLS
jgi:hypothetical protein